MSDLKKRIESWQKRLVERNTDYFYLSSFDHFLSEYVPKGDSMRVFLTGFTGSVAEAVVPKEGKIKLYVDGRYHEQADQECDLSIIEVVKVPFGQPLRQAMVEDLPQKASMAIIPERTPQTLKEDLSDWTWLDLKEADFQEITGFKPDTFKGPLWQVDYFQKDGQVTGRAEKLIGKNEYAFINALDTLSWISGLRGCHLPYQGTYRGVGLLSREKLIIFAPDSEYNELRRFDDKQRQVEEERQAFDVLKTLDRPDKVWWDPGHTTVANYDTLCEAFGKGTLEKHPGYHSQWQAPKTTQEIHAFEKSFERSDKAIYDGLCWLIERSRSGDKVNERQFRDQINLQYKKQGVRTQSFRTIAGFGASSSIIHFGSPSETKFYENGELVLVDSGGIYEEGVATDCTRTIIPLGRATEKQKLQYTCVLKGLLNLLMASVPEGTPGKVLDEIARAPLKEHGFDFAHGTGHGVGVNVHEAGYSIRPGSEVPIKSGLVGSLEPGFYEPGVGGIRLENIVVVEKDPEIKGNICFRNLVHIGFWEDLIDHSLLTDKEADYLKAYEQECSKRGRSFGKFFQ